MQKQSKTSINIEIAYNIYNSIYSAGSTARFRRRNIFTKSIYGNTFDKKVIDYIDSKKHNSHYLVSSLNPLIDMCLKYGVLDPKDFAYYVSLFEKKDIKKNNHLTRVGGCNYGIFSERSAVEYIHCDLVNTLYAGLVYSDNISYMFMSNKLEPYIKKNSDELKMILKERFSIGMNLKK